MQLRATVPSIRCGIKGVSHTGRYHLERLSLRPEFQIVAVHDPDTMHVGIAEQLPARSCATSQELLELGDVECVFIATPPETHEELILEALKSGKHVAVEKPLCLSAEEALRIVQASQKMQRSVVVVQFRRWDDDFRTALETVCNGTLGRLHAVRFVMWSFAVIGRGCSQDPQETPSVASKQDDVLTTFGAHYLDQLLQLMPDAIDRVHARILRPDNMPTSPSGTQPPATAFHAHIAFADGADALVDVNLASPVPLQTGWVLLAQHGGYQNGQRYEMTESGEIFATPVDRLPTDWDLFYHGLAGHLRRDEPPPVTLEEACRVVALTDTIRQSAETGMPAAVVEIAE